MGFLPITHKTPFKMRLRSHDTLCVNPLSTQAYCDSTPCSLLIAGCVSVGWQHHHPVGVGSSSQDQAPSHTRDVPVSASCVCYVIATAPRLCHNLNRTALD
jgi:hypothetical protein